MNVQTWPHAFNRKEKNGTDLDETATSPPTPYRHHQISQNHLKKLLPNKKLKIEVRWGIQLKSQIELMTNRKKTLEGKEKNELISGDKDAIVPVVGQIAQIHRILKVKNQI